MTSDPRPRPAAVPTFSRPASMTDTQPLPMVPPQRSMTNETTTDRPPINPPFPPSDRGASPGPRENVFQRFAGTRTGTSSADGPTDKAKPARIAKLDEETAAKVAAAVLGVAVLGGAVLVRWRSKNTKRLRQPTDDQRDEIAKPAARILLRHMPGSWSHDLLDACLSIAGLGVYINDGPITEPFTTPGEIPSPDPEE